MNYLVKMITGVRPLCRSPIQPGMESNICLEKYKSVSNENLTIKISCLDMYGDINLVLTYSNLP